MDKRVNPISPSAQIDLGFGSTPEQLQRKKPADPGYKEVHAIHNPPEKDQKAKAAENKEFADNRQPKSPLIRQAAINDMKQMLNMAGAASDLEKGMMTQQKKKTYLHVSIDVLVEFILQTFQVDGRVFVDLVLVRLQDVEVGVLKNNKIEIVIL